MHRSAGRPEEGKRNSEYPNRQVETSVFVFERDKCAPLLKIFEQSVFCFRLTTPAKRGT